MPVEELHDHQVQCKQTYEDVLKAYSGVVATHIPVSGKVEQPSSNFINIKTYGRLPDMIPKH